MMSAYSLPQSINISGVEYEIRSDFRVILDILVAMSDPDMSDWEKQEVMFQIIYPGYETIPKDRYIEACEKAVDFIDYGLPSDKPKPKTMDWEQDGPIIIPAVNKVAGMEVRSLPYLHWWTFLGYFMEIEDGLASQVWAIRQKHTKGKKLEKWEKEFERNNPGLVNLKKVYSEQQRREMSSIEKWL